MKKKLLTLGVAAALAFLSVPTSAMTSQEAKTIDSAIAAHSGSVSELVTSLINQNVFWAPDVVAKVMEAKPAVQYPSIVQSALNSVNEQSSVIDVDNLDQDPKVLLLRAIADQAVKSGMSQDDVVLSAANAGVDVTLLFPTAAGGEQPAPAAPQGIRNTRNGNEVSPS